VTGHQRDRIRQLNDHARRSFLDCRVVITRGVAELDDLPAVLRAVQRFDDFTADNDPYGEHDFGALRVGYAEVFWTFSYYDIDQEMLSPDPSDDAVTVRVLTIMLAREY
jgi:hypothetical protein